MQDYWTDVGSFEIDTISDFVRIGAWVSEYVVHIPGHLVEMLIQHFPATWRFFELAPYGWTQAIIGWYFALEIFWIAFATWAEEQKEIKLFWQCTWRITLIMLTPVAVIGFFEWMGMI
jgi:hypothetical protein